MAWSLYPARDAFGRFAADWDALNARHYAGHPLLDTRFVGPLVEHFAGGRERLAVHRAGGAVDAAALLTPRRGVWRLFLPSQAQVAPTLLPTAAHASSLLHSLPATAVGLDLPCVDPDYSAASELAALAAHEAAPHATTLNISLAGTFEAYWQSRSRHLRQQMRRALRKAEEAGLASRLEVLSRPADVLAALARYGDIESRGWKAGLGTAIHGSNLQGRFYAAVLAGFAAAGRASVWELHLGPHLAASQLCIASEGMLITLKTTHEESLGPYWPGRMLDYLQLEQVFASGRHRVVEWYTNATAETLRWGTAQRTIGHHRLYRFAWMLPLAQRVRRVRAALEGRRAAESAADASGGPRAASGQPAADA